jgi:hypothetical protein
MKKFIFRNIWLLSLFCPFIQVFGQEDSIKSKEKEPDFVNDKFRERTSMFYIAVKSGIENGQKGLTAYSGAYTGYEFKISKLNVIGAGLGLYYQYHNADFKNYEAYNLLTQINITYKYFYNLDRRMSKGLTGNNFSANYFLLSPNLSYTRSPYYITSYTWDFTKGSWLTKYERNVQLIPKLKIGYGFQRTLRNKWNFDINAGIQLQNYNSGNSLDDLLFGQFIIGYIIK